MNRALKYLMVGILTMAMPAMASDCSQDCQRSLVDAYFSQLADIYKAGSTPQQIDQLFNSLHPSVEYEHLRYEARFNAGEWREAFLGNLERGAYNNEPNQAIRISNTIYGHNHLAVSYSYGRVTQQIEWMADGDQNLMAVFTIKDGKISKVQEYW